MRYFVALVLVVMAVGMFLVAPDLARRTQRSNEAFFGEGSFQGDGWRRWNIFVARLIAVVLVVMAVLLASGLVDFVG